MLTIEQHIDNLVRHIQLVHSAGLLLGKKLIAEGDHEIGRTLIAHVFVHDASKFAGIEWDYLHAGKDVPKNALELAVKHHVRTNSHHPEFWGNFDKMSPVYIAEMACDLLARSQEFGTDLRDWLKNVGIAKYKINVEGENYKHLCKYINMLTESQFA